MKLKLLITFLGMLSLMSKASATAIETIKNTNSVKTKTVSSIEKKNNKKVVHQTNNQPAMVEPAPNHDYKQENGPIPTEPHCLVCTSDFLMDSMTQNIGRAMPNPCSPGWFERIHISGGIAIDMGKWGHHHTGYMGENYQHISLNDVYLNVKADVNNWAQAFASISYNTATINAPKYALYGFHVAEYSAAYSNNIISGSTNTLQLEQAYFTLGNFEFTPIFIQLGKQFQDFSRYEIHPITRSMTQVLSETLATSLKVGFLVPMGFHGSVFVFDNPISKIHHTSRKTNFGASFGYDYTNPIVGWDFGVGYLYNMIGVNDVAYNVNQFNLSRFLKNDTPFLDDNVNPLYDGDIATGDDNVDLPTPPTNKTKRIYPLYHGGKLPGFYHSGYRHKVDATALYADIHAGPFYVGARYTTALRHFNRLDLPTKVNLRSLKGKKSRALANPTTDTLPPYYDFHYGYKTNRHRFRGAKPWAAGIQAGFGFETNWGWECVTPRTQTLYVGYQTSSQAAALNLPKARWVAGYGIEAWQNTHLGIEWDHDRAYSEDDTHWVRRRPLHRHFSTIRNRHHSDLVTIRASVQFG